MEYSKCTQLGLAFVLAAAMFLRPAAAEEPLPVEPQAGVLLLTNGQTLSGKITRAGDRYYVALADGAINLAANQVLLHCRDLPDAYERQRAARVAPNVQHHLKLAQWCLENKLNDEAARELDAAARIEPNHSKIILLRRRLELLASPIVSQPTTNTTTRTVVSAEELERLSRNMPAGSMEGYANTVQPLLLNHCAAAACHGAQSKTSLRILRGAGGGAPSRRLTQRNLYHVLEHIDRDHPEESRLLTAASQPHGPSRAPVLSGNDSEQFRRLVEWIRLVSRTPQAVEPPLLEIDPHELVRKLPPADAAVANGTPAQNGALAAKWSAIEGDAEFRIAEDGSILTSLPSDQIVDDQGKRPPRSNKPPIRGAAGMAQRANVRRGAVPQITPRDPFDPELFNRQHHPPR